MRAVYFDENGFKPCTKCKRLLPRDSFNVGRRYKSGYASSCKDCKKEFRQDNSDKIAEYKKEFYEKNKDSILEKQKEYRVNNIEQVKLAEKQKYIRYRDKIIARVSEYYKKKPEVNRLACKKYRQATPEKQVAASAKYRARKRNAVPPWAYDEFEQLCIAEIYDLAQRRSRVLGIAIHVDHIVPLKSDLVCGLHCKDNLQILSGKENSAKRNHYWPDMP